MFRQEELELVQRRFPPDFAGPEVRYGPAKRAHGVRGEVGTYVDEWGCVWQVAEPGVVGEVKEPPLADWLALAHFEPPWEILEEADFSQVNESCAATDKFVLAGTTVRPFERMQFLRGTENLFIDLAYGTPEVYRLRDLVHEFFCRELEMWVRTDVDGISFMDDWGAQNALLLHPQLWREFFKPLYKDYCDLIRGRGKFVFVHSDGYIEPVYPDLIELGVHAINSQLFCMDIEELGRKYRGKITFWGEIDRQWLLPFGTPAHVRQAVKRVRRALDTGRGGVIAQCEFGLRDPVENILAVFEAWEEGNEGRRLNPDG